MKKILMLLVASLIVLVVVAQKNKNQSENIDPTTYKCVRDYLDATQHDFLKAHSLFAGSTVQNDQWSYSPDVMKQALDSMVVMAQGWTKDWIIDEVEYYTYNSQGKCIEILNLSPSGDGSFLFISKESMSYDNQARPVEFITYETVELQNGKVEFDYSNDLLSKLIFYSWDESINEWSLLMKDEFSYDANSNLTLINTFEWDGTAFNPYYKEEISYLNNHYMNESVSYLWNSNISDWDPSMKDEYIYDDDWNNTLFIQSDWVSVEWKPFYKTEYTFEGENMVLSVTSSSYSYDDWIFEDKDSISYYENGNPDEEFYYQWNYGSWMPQYKDVFTFNDDYPTDELMLPFFWDYYFNNMLIKVDKYDWWEPDWIASFQFILYYSEKNVDAISEMNLDDISVYPNPNNGIFTLKIDNENRNTDIAIIDFFGRELNSEMIRNQAGEIVKTLDLTTYGSGVYFLQITQGDKISYKKVVVQ